MKDFMAHICKFDIHMKSFAVVFYLSLKQKDANQLREEYSRLVQGIAGGGVGHKQTYYSSMTFCAGKSCHSHPSILI